MMTIGKAEKAAAAPKDAEKQAAPKEPFSYRKAVRNNWKTGAVVIAIIVAAIREQSLVYREDPEMLKPIISFTMRSHFPFVSQHCSDDSKVAKDQGNNFVKRAFEALATRNLPALEPWK